MFPEDTQGSGSGCKQCHAANTVCATQVNIQAYLLWEQAGQPEGADFAGDARATLEAQLAGGQSLQDIETALRAPKPKVSPCSTLMRR